MQIALREYKMTMNKNIFFGLVLTFVAGTSVQAQTLKDARKKADNERYELARKDFQALIQKDPASIDNAFYYGNFLVMIDENAAAIEQFKAAAAKNAEDKLAMVSSAKAIYFSGDTTTAGIKFRELIKATKSKNACVLLRVAETYATAPTKNLPLAEAYLTKVVMLEPQNVEAMQLLGDIIIEQSTSRVSQAVEQYNNVLKIEPTNASAIVKKAYIYERVKNEEAAMQGYEESMKIDATFAPAYRRAAELHMKQGNYDKSAENWTKYLSLNDDPQARYRYATSLFVGKKFDLALIELDKVEKSGIVNAYTKRMRFYSLFDANTAGDPAMYQKTLDASTDFFSAIKPEKIVASDYMYLANTYWKLGKTAEAIEALDKAATLDKASAGDLLTKIGTKAFKDKDYKTAIAAYSKKYAVAPDNMKATDYFEMGKAYYFDTDKNFVMADSSFAMLNRVSPNYALGYIYRGRALAQMDTDINKRNWKAQVPYETFFSKLTEADKTSATYKEFITEASRYLGDYYVNSPAKDPAKAKLYWGQVLANEPTDKQALLYFKTH